jgi:hypothetical protein
MPITIPEFPHAKQSSQGREERIKFIIEKVKEDPDFHFEAPAYTKERCTDLAAITDLINFCLRMMLYGPQTRKDITEQILLMLKII